MSVTVEEITELRLDDQAELTYAYLVMLTTALRLANLCVTDDQSHLARSAHKAADDAMHRLRTGRLVPPDRQARIEDIAPRTFPRLQLTRNTIERSWVMAWHAYFAAQRLAHYPNATDVSRHLVAELQDVIAHVGEMPALPSQRQRLLAQTLTPAMTSREGQRMVISHLPFA